MFGHFSSVCFRLGKVTLGYDWLGNGISV